MNYQTDTYEAEYYKGWLVITIKAERRNECVQLTNGKGRNITRSQFKSAIKSHGVDRACQTFVKLAAKYKPTSIPADRYA